MKMAQIITAVPALQKLADERLSLKTLYKVNLLLSSLDKEISFYNNERMKIIESVGHNIQGDKWAIADDKRAEFEERTTELLNLEVETEIKPVMLPTSENIRMSYNDIKALQGFVELDFVDS